jgi:hypothetical protein
MGTITLETTEAPDDVRFLVQSAIASEIAKLELGLALAQQRLRPFEHKYHVSSEHFIAEFAAEDLEGGDDEYVRWAGEYQLKQRLETKLARLKGIQVS